MSSCDFISTAHVSFANHNGHKTVNARGFQPILPLFSYKTNVIIELLVAKHGSFAQDYPSQYPGTFDLINANSLELILGHAGINDPNTNQRILQTKLNSYKLMLRNKGKTILKAPETTDRYLHFDAKVSSTGYYTPSSVNTKHLALQKQLGINLKNEFIALEFFAPFYYPYYFSLKYLNEGTKWQNMIDRAIDRLSNYKKYSLDHIFRDESYKIFGEKKDKITKPLFKDIIAAKVRQYRKNTRFNESMLNRYCREIEAGRRTTSVDISNIYDASGR
ncbi:hypothetical protein [uncultured Shewanella sp.]|uniref:hypothetical protein n=1 Tax=uncultured Shewanella sp. TaxID=173975 RepID=UPI0026397748|nr:hypothetical protein [uncultured Shewanella sp.]